MKESVSGYSTTEDILITDTPQMLITSRDFLTHEIRFQNPKLSKLKLEGVEIFSGTNDGRKLILVSRLSNQTTIQLHLLNLDIPKDDTYQLDSFTLVDQQTITSLSQSASITKITCRLLKPATITCVMAGFGARYVSLSLDYTLKTAKIEDWI